MEERIGLRANLAGRTALVTGASSGVGRATALAFAREGIRVVVTARRADKLDSLVREIAGLGGKAVAVPGDAAEPSTAKAAVAKCIHMFGRLDFLINNAGQGAYKQPIDTSVDDYDALMAANMRSSFIFSREAAPYLIAQRSGTMVFISSVAGLHGTGNEAVYSATKFAQVGFAQALDDELRPFGIKVCILCPGGIKTEFALGRGRTDEGVRASTMMESTDVAEAILFLCAQPANVRILQTTIRNMGEQK
jgi:NAD(P)-dependent dehydrogenase (short-subunit alcohol dehydrogenase family)